MREKEEIGSEAIVAQAKAFSADLAGIARVADLKASPSHWLTEIMNDFEEIETHQTKRMTRGVVAWPEGAESAIVLAIAHPEDRPELDWWEVTDEEGNTTGNRHLTDVVGKLSEWLEKNSEIHCYKTPYLIKNGGIYLKDAAVLAGLGCIGMNNLLITPQFGPRLRIRVMLVDAVLTPTGPIDFEPCAGCDMPCRKACPQGAFNFPVYLPAAYGRGTLPGRTGVYDRLRCGEQMLIDEANVETITAEGQAAVEQRVKYCRRCETSCPVGKK